MLNHHRLYIHFLIFLPSYLRKDHNTGFFITGDLWKSSGGKPGPDIVTSNKYWSGFRVRWDWSLDCAWTRRIISHRVGSVMGVLEPSDTDNARCHHICIVCVCACNNFCVQTRLIWMWERNKHGCTSEMLTQPVLSYRVGWVAQHQYVILQPQCLHLLPLIGV